jgi:hypothetical protein
VITIESNIRAFARVVKPDGAYARNIRFATALALTSTARDVKSDAKRRLPRVIDRPTRFTLMGLFMKSATKAQLQASVYFKDRQAEYLERLEDGGVRRPKRRALVVPARGRANQYGNLPRRRVQATLSASHGFSGKVRGTGGVWRRLKSGKLRLIAVYVDRASYEPQLGFKARAQDMAQARMRPNMTKAWNFAVRTSREGRG